MRRSLTAALLALLALAAPASAAQTRCNVAIEMTDGATMRANLFLPEGGGRFPTVLTVSGYNKDVTNPLGAACSGSGGLATADTSLTDDGYAVMLVDDRGTGASEGKWDSWGRRTQRDYREILDWIQAQDWSNGSVATTGASYMGITSLLVAEADAARVAQGKPRAVRAVWADVPMSDAYRDVTFHGGAVDAGFIPLWLGLTTSLSYLPPSNLLESPADALANYTDHLRNGYDFALQKILNTALGSDDAFDGPFYRLRSPGRLAGRIRVPVVVQGGWWDIFQRGTPLLYEQLVRSPHKKLIMSPHYHTDGGPPMEDPDLKEKWFARWLKGERNGVEHTPDISFYPVNGTRWQHPRSWPPKRVRYTPFYVGDDRALVTRPPARGAADQAPLLPVSSPCSRLTTQWTAGAAMGCDTDNSSFEATALTYTTPPLERRTQIMGPVVADLWAELTSKDATLVAVVSDVAPSGTSEQITAGFLQASQRAIDRKRSTFAGRTMIRPFHPFTRASKRPVVANDPTRYRIEVYPTSAMLEKGHRIRLTISSANTPSTLAPLPDQVNALGGQLRLLRGDRYPSHVLLPVR